MNLLYFAKSSVCFIPLGVSPLSHRDKSAFTIAVSGKLGSEGQAKKRSLKMSTHKAPKTDPLPQGGQDVLLGERENRDILL